MADCCRSVIFVLVSAYSLALLTPAQAEVQVGNVPDGQKPVVVQKSPVSIKPFKLSEHPDCISDIQKYCKRSTNNNFAVIDCLQNDLRDDDEISDACQHVIWQYKRNLTSDSRYEAAVSSVCKEDIRNISECQSVGSGKGFIISCMIFNLDSVSNVNCREFLRRMETIVFSDYRMIYQFVESCDPDIQKYNCGRLDENADESDSKGKRQGIKKPHDQGKTIYCLAEKAGDLTPKCRHQLLRVAELQAEDYHSDRQLYFACREDRETFCPSVTSGGGNVYKCLYRHKLDQRMSVECRKKLTVRQKLQHDDYKVNGGIAVACHNDIINKQCMKVSKDAPQTEMVSLATVLVCLERAVRQEDAEPLAPECVVELKEVRRSLLEDYEISPEVASACRNEIENQCKRVARRQTVHCLMDLARPSKSQSQKRASNKCVEELTNLIEEADVDEDYSVDPSLQEACGVIVNSHCQDVPSGEGRVYDCLMSLVGKPAIMTPECKEKLMEVQYFVSRNFNLSPRFIRQCSSVMRKDCPYEPSANHKDDVKLQANTLLCLYQKMNSDKDFNGGECASEVRRVMMERAKSVDLDPEVEEACITDLGYYCSDKTEKNEEMDCLENNMNSLTDDCRKVVTDYTERIDEMPELSTIFAEACQKFWKEYCKEAAESGKEDSETGSLMSCLISNKFHAEMNNKCRAGIEHHQLITMNDYKLSRGFRDACTSDVQRYCVSNVKAITKKGEIIECLSTMVRNDTFLDKAQRVSKDCRTQLTFELLQRSADIKLDESLSRDCAEDVEEFCKNVSPGKSQISDCLRRNQQKLRPKCHSLLFKREQEEADDPTTDFNLMTKCKRMIKKYCLDDVSADKKDKLVDCLVQHKEEEDDFDPRCAKVLVSRLRVRAKDIRLNPDLMRSCKKDINDHCRKELEIVSGQQSEAEGQVMFCLRKQFALKKLQHSCMEHVLSVIKESVLDYVQDVRLAKGCAEEIKQFCSDAVEEDTNDEHGGRGEVVECLRQHVLIKPPANFESSTTCVQELARVLSENKADVHLDPLLYRACAIDLKIFCADVPRGDGRQMSCLLSTFDDKIQKEKLKKECSAQLANRIELWAAAVKMAPPDNIQELLDQVYESDSRTYLLAVLATVLLFIFVGGLCCGRVTKRVAHQVKIK